MQLSDERLFSARARHDFGDYRQLRRVRHDLYCRRARLRGQHDRRRGHREVGRYVWFLLAHPIRENHRKRGRGGREQG